MARPELLYFPDKGNNTAIFCGGSICAEATFVNSPVNIFNLGHSDYLDVNRLSDIVISEMGLKNVKKRFTGGKRGWIGDSPFVHLDIGKLEKAGWKPKVSIEEGIRRTARYLLENPEILRRRG